MDKISDSTLDDLFKQLDQLHENTLTFSSAENFSLVYGYWISQLAKLTVKQGISFYTSRSVIRLMVGLVKPQTAMSIYDPSAGTGGMLIESVNYVSQHSGDVNSIA